MVSIHSPDFLFQRSLKIRQLLPHFCGCIRRVPTARLTTSFAPKAADSPAPKPQPAASARNGWPKATIFRLQVLKPPEDLLYVRHGQGRMIIL
jgi:hypothetical protein